MHGRLFAIICQTLHSMLSRNLTAEESGVTCD